MILSYFFYGLSCWLSLLAYVSIEKPEFFWWVVFAMPLIVSGYILFLVVLDCLIWWAFGRKT